VSRQDAIASQLAIAPAATALNRGLIPLLPLQRPLLDHIQHSAAFTCQQMHRPGNAAQVAIGSRTRSFAVFFREPKL
jgi:hypothetical protein